MYFEALLCTFRYFKVLWATSHRIHLSPHFTTFTSSHWRWMAHLVTRSTDEKSNLSNPTRQARMLSTMMRREWEYRWKSLYIWERATVGNDQSPPHTFQSRFVYILFFLHFEDVLYFGRGASAAAAVLVNADWLHMFTRWDEARATRFCILFVFVYKHICICIHTNTFIFVFCL